MLAKLWKKVLLVICILACIFNIMSKLVAKTSLELNLKSVENGESIMSVFKETQEESKSNTITSQDTINAEVSTQNNVVQEETQAKNTTDFVVIY